MDREDTSKVVLQMMLYFTLEDIYRPQGMVGHTVLECVLSVLQASVFIFR